MFDKRKNSLLQALSQHILPIGIRNSLREIYDEEKAILARVSLSLNQVADIRCGANFVKRILYTRIDPFEGWISCDRAKTFRYPGQSERKEKRIPLAWLATFLLFYFTRIRPMVEQESFRGRRKIVLTRASTIRRPRVPNTHPSFIPFLRSFLRSMRSNLGRSPSFHMAKKKTKL